MDKFIIINSESEASLSVNQKYLILIRNILLVCGKQDEKPEYRIAVARYHGEGKWDEIMVTETSSADEPEEIIEDTYVSCTHNAAVMDWRDYYKYNGNDDVKYCVDVVAYYPYPELPDLSMIPPVKI